MNLETLARLVAHLKELKTGTKINVAWNDKIKICDDLGVAHKILYLNRESFCFFEKRALNTAWAGR